jgi:biotin carboxyl carrier protein
VTLRPFEIELDGQRRLVALRREGDGWIAGIDGREFAVSVVEVGGRWSMLVGRSSYDIAFEPGTNGALIVHVNGRAVPLTVDRPGSPTPWAKAARRGARDGELGTGLQTIVAPMPGRIVKVLVKPDEAVAARQPLVVVEAMKMENELRAPRDGTVAEVRVSEGESVEANTVLVVLR